jgi:hypothetical protein
VSGADAGFAVSGDIRVVRFTAPGSRCSIIVGTGMTSATSSSVQGALQLVVADIEAVYAELVGHGAAGR